MSEREAARMLERLRATEEDEEFERAFRSMVRLSLHLQIVQYCYITLHIISLHISSNSLFLCVLCALPQSGLDAAIKVELKITTIF